MSLYNILLSFFTYGFLGWCAEVAFAAVKQREFVNRGFLNGPLCPIYGVGVTVVVAALEPFVSHPLFLYLLSAVLVTVLEGLTGYVLEKIFHHKWWDYSGMPMNIRGYVCVPFSLIWGVACVIIVKYVHPLLAKLFEVPPVWLGAVLLVLMCSGLLTDLYVTVSGILKWNRRLERMAEIADELHRLSDQIGENIYQNMMDGLEWSERSREKAVARHQELKKKYQELAETQRGTGRRLLKAFPKMQSARHDKQIAALRMHLKREKGKEKNARHCDMYPLYWTKKIQ